MAHVNEESHRLTCLLDVCPQMECGIMSIYSKYAILKIQDGGRCHVEVCPKKECTSSIMFKFNDDI